MKFLDKKEQVLDIQLTPYGEYLLSQGKLKPEYYAFFDDNILYEPQYAGYTDLQKDIESRIQEDTPQLESQIVFSDRDLFARKGLTASDSLELKEEHIQTDSYHDRKRYGLQHQLGKSDILKTNAPAWSIDMLKSEISTSSRVDEGELKHTSHIPQLNATLTYVIDVVNDRRFISDSTLAVEYPNGQYLDIRPEYLLAQVIERNAEFAKENFDIEVFEVLTEKVPGMDKDAERLRPLKMRKPFSLVQGDILLDESEVFTNEDLPLTTEDVEYYFNLRVDSDIDEALVCKAVGELESKGRFVDTEIVCEDTRNITLADIYSTDAAAEPCPEDSPGSGEPCDDIGSVY
tara:strand:+ start:731 stop:1768 length:1038 start_codon:yes stop_codon:yes gene_type:complete